MSLNSRWALSKFIGGIVAPTRDERYHPTGGCYWFIAEVTASSCRSDNVDLGNME